MSAKLKSNTFAKIVHCVPLLLLMVSLNSNVILTYVPLIGYCPVTSCRESNYSSITKVAVLSMIAHYTYHFVTSCHVVMSNILSQFHYQTVQTGCSYLVNDGTQASIMVSVATE